MQCAFERDERLSEWARQQAQARALEDYAHRYSTRRQLARLLFGGSTYGTEYPGKYPSEYSEDYASGVSEPDSFFGALLEAWHRADAGDITIATGVSQWNDKTSNGHDLVQATGGDQPAFDASAGPNSTGEVDFDGANHYLNVDIGNIFAKNDRPSLIIIGSYDDLTAGISQNMAGLAEDTGATATLLEHKLHATSDEWRYVTHYDNGGAGAFDTVDITNDTDNHLFELHLFTAGHVAYSDNTSAALAQSAGISARADAGTGQNLSLGGLSDGTATADCKINEFMLLNDEPTAAMRTSLFAYVNDRYGKSIS